MSNILWLTPEVPYPPVGGRNGVYHRIVQMSKYNTIHLLSIAYSDSEIEPAKSEMLKFCNTCNFYNRNVTKFKNYFKSLFMPYSVASRTSKVIVNDIINAVLENSIDIIIIEFPNMVLNVIKALKSKKLSGKHVIVSLNQHNIEYVRMRELYNVKNISYKKRIAYFLESFRLERYESKIYKTNIFDSITFFSADDVRYFGDRWDNISAQLKVFPLGVNLVKIESFEKK